MPIENVYSIEGQGTVVTGKIERGRVRAGDLVEVVGLTAEPRQTVARSVETFGRGMAEGEAGDNVGVLLRGIKREEVERGQALVKPGSLAPHTRLVASIY